MQSIKQLKEANGFTDQYLGGLYEKLDCLSHSVPKGQIIFKADYDWNLKFNDENEQNRQNAIIEYIDDQCRKILQLCAYDTLQWTLYQQEHNHDNCSEDHNLIITIKKI